LAPLPKVSNSSIEITESTVTPIPTAVARQRRRGMPQHPPRPHPWGNQDGQQISRRIEDEHQKPAPVDQSAPRQPAGKDQKYSFIKIRATTDGTEELGRPTRPVITARDMEARYRCRPLEPDCWHATRTRRTWTKTAKAARCWFASASLSRPSWVRHERTPGNRTRRAPYANNPCPEPTNPCDRPAARRRPADPVRQTTSHCTELP
jgi:hypothetical protein